MVLSGEVENPFSKSEWNTIIQATAESVVKDDPLRKPFSPQQKYSRFISGGVVSVPV